MFTEKVHHLILIEYTMLHIYGDCWIPCNFLTLTITKACQVSCRLVITKAELGLKVYISYLRWVTTLLVIRSKLKLSASLYYHKYMHIYIENWMKFLSWNSETRKLEEIGGVYIYINCKYKNFAQNHAKYATQYPCLTS